MVPDLPGPIAEYMADLINEIPMNTSTNEKEKLIIENLFIEILKDDKLKNQLTQVISNVTKNTLKETNAKLGDAERTILELRANRTKAENINSKRIRDNLEITNPEKNTKAEGLNRKRNKGYLESTNLETSTNTEGLSGKRNKGNLDNSYLPEIFSNVKRNKDSIDDLQGILTAPKENANNEFTRVEFNPPRSRGNIKSITKIESNRNESETNEDDKTIKEDENILPRRKNNKPNRQKNNDGDLVKIEEYVITTARNEVDENTANTPPKRNNNKPNRQKNRDGDLVKIEEDITTTARNEFDENTLNTTPRRSNNKANRQKNRIGDLVKIEEDTTTVRNEIDENTSPKKNNIKPRQKERDEGFVKVKEAITTTLRNIIDENIPRRKNNKSNRQKDRGEEVKNEEGSTTIKNEIDEDENVTIQTDDSDKFTTIVTINEKTETTTPNIKPSTRRNPAKDTNRHSEKKKQPTKLNLEDLDERGKFHNGYNISNE